MAFLLKSGSRLACLAKQSLGACPEHNIFLECRASCYYSMIHPLRVNKITKIIYLKDEFISSIEQRAVFAA
jgi:hypothetical protein